MAKVLPKNQSLVLARLERLVIGNVLNVRVHFITCAMWQPEF